MRVLEQQEKLTRISALLTEKDLDAIVFKKSANIAWLIGGRAHVPTTLELSCLDLVVYRDRIVVVTNKIEAQRLKVEELTGAEELLVVNWFEGREEQLPRGQRIGVDVPDKERVNLSREIEEMRRNLTEFEVTRLKEIGADAGAALGQAMVKVSPSMSELAVAGLIAEHLWERDLEPVVLLVAGEHRIRRFRHPLPTRELIGGTALGVVCARRKGLIASVTRHVNFGSLSQEMTDGYLRLLRVEAAFLDQTRPGATLAEAFKSGQEAYATEGFAHDEWTKHHQGGPTGYLPRDFLAHENTVEVIHPWNAIAWNPSAEGLKVEDTIVTTLTGFDFVTQEGDWPTIDVSGRNRPAIQEIL